MPQQQGNYRNFFDFAQPRTDPAEHEAGVEYHRIGKDFSLQLLDVALPANIPPGTESLEPAEPAAERVASLASESLSVPRLTKASFLAPTRQRTVPALPSEAPPPTAPSPEPPAPAAPGADAAPAADAAETSRDAPFTKPPTPATAVAPAVEQTGATASPISYDILLGAETPTPQYGLLGEVAGRKVALDLNETHTVSLFGVQGGGKSYTLGAIAEMTSLPVTGINTLPRPLATVIFHYSPTQDYAPEFTSMAAPNDNEAQVRLLRERYGAAPKALDDVILLVPRDDLDQRRAEYPSLAVHPLTFSSSELKIGHWRFLMGAVGNQATYIRQLNRIMRAHRDGLTLDRIRAGIDDSRLTDHIKELAHQRLDLAADYIDDNARLSELIRPGRLIIVDLRDEFIEKDESLGLFVVLLQLFADTPYQGEPFNKLVVFDEAHKYIDSPDLVAGLVEVVREMRHKGVSIMVASQDPPSVPVSLIELSSEVILHRFGSPAWLKHIQRANAALAELTPAKMANLKPGEAYIWSSKATDAAFSHGAVKVILRPRVTRHGGATRTAVRES